MITGTLTGLRAITHEDLPQLLIWRNRPSLRRYFREVSELNMAQQERWYEAVVLNGAQQARMFAIERLEDHILIGACGLTSLDWLRRSGELSFYIGLGDIYCDTDYAPDAARVLLDYGFSDLGLNRIWTETYAFDSAKAILLSSLRFQKEGCLRDHHWAEGRFWDSNLYGLLRSEHGTAHIAAVT